MTKDDNVKILSITAVDEGESFYTILGLGDDQKIYKWIRSYGTWKLYSYRKI